MSIIHRAQASYDFKEQLSRLPRTLWKYMTVDTARQTLATGRLRFQSPLRYNDPLDSQWNPLWQTTTKQARAALLDRVKLALAPEPKIPEWTTPNKREILNELRASLDNVPTEVREHLREHACQELANTSLESIAMKRRHTNLLRSFRVSCFSSTPSSVLMWSHYADQHRGVVLGFDAAELAINMTIPPYEIQYTTELPEVLDVERWADFIVYGYPDLEHDVGMNCLTVKHEEWRYESEWRLVFASNEDCLGDYEDVEFPKQTLTCMYAGCRTDLSRMRELAALALPYNADVECAQMQLHPEALGLTTTPLDF